MIFSFKGALTADTEGALLIAGSTVYDGSVQAGELFAFQNINIASGTSTNIVSK